ncbi:excalibur calcium-binding domain-containing protein [Methylophilus sp. OH31]|uniref:excalibur calcium-binding domain-containing protein n=1 Tax=Methylophilus sp. OH31 TaxID=1387312 RepID=UPI0009DF74CB|nr:excalibur calcium-binding domain-containing protein [Methylophilus sp. OH31]
MNIIKIFSIVMLCCAGYIAFDNVILPSLKAHNPQPQTTTVVHDNTAIATPTHEAEPAMQESLNATCDGHTHCSQMHSCAEAKQWLSRCPSAEMDGDGDGIPCERQWCHTGFN